MMTDDDSRTGVWVAQRKAAEAIVREWEVRAPRLEPMCRMLLLAERYSVTLLRDRCLHALAARFEALVEERAPRQEREVFEAFVAAVAPRVRASMCLDSTPCRRFIPP